MPRPKWQINDENFYDVLNYLERNKQALYLRVASIESPAKLHAIVEDELNLREIASMRSSIRMNKSRAIKEVRRNKDVNITITPEAHQLISQLCERDQLTISDCLIRNLEMLVEMPDKTRNELINKWS